MRRDVENGLFKADSENPRLPPTNPHDETGGGGEHYPHNPHTLKGGGDGGISRATPRESNRRRLAADEAKRIRRLIDEGMSERWVRAEVLGEES